MRLLQGWWAVHEVLCVCFLDEVSCSWGLLALRKTPKSAVRWYEAGIPGCEAILRQVLLVLSQLEDVPTEVPRRSHAAAQGLRT